MIGRKTIRWFHFIIIFSIFGMVLIGGFVYMVWYGKKIVCDDYEKYMTHEITGVYSPLVIFPEEKISAIDSEYYFELRDELFESKCQIYLKNVYSGEMFEKEVNRIEQLRYVYMEQENRVYLDNINYANKAYVALANWDDRYEYAIIFENVNTIVYVYIQNIDETDIKMNKLFLPVFYEEGEQDLYKKQDDHLSIYAFRIGNQYIECMDLGMSIK